LFQRLLERFGGSLFKIGESDGGRKLKVTLKEYIEYALYGRDDSPLYMFEASLEEHPEARVMMDDYTPPELVKEDLFTELVSQTRLKPLARRTQVAPASLVFDRAQAVGQRGAPRPARYECLELEYLGQKTLGNVPS